MRSILGRIFKKTIVPHCWAKASRQNARLRRLPSGAQLERPITYYHKQNIYVHTRLLQIGTRTVKKIYNLGDFKFKRFHCSSRTHNLSSRSHFQCCHHI